jgi:glutamyl-tRNA(Gln) amidotransferase subunit D
MAAAAIAANATFAEVVVALHEGASDEYVAIHRGTRVRKCHTSRRDAFKTIDSNPMGRINLRDMKLELLTELFQPRNNARNPEALTDFEEKVALLKFHPSFNPEIIDWYRERKYRGIVLEGTGLGHVSKICYRSIEQAIEADLLVAMTSQCIWGMVDMNVYETGRDLLALGVIPLGDMIPETAYVKMMWVLGQTRDLSEARKMMTTPVAHELTGKRLLRS